MQRIRREAYYEQVENSFDMEAWYELYGDDDGDDVYDSFAESIQLMHEIQRKCY